MELPAGTIVNTDSTEILSESEFKVDEVTNETISENNIQENILPQGVINPESVVEFGID